MPVLGVTGARALPLAARPALLASVRALLRALPVGVMVSPLAEGADQLAAEAALAEGWRLDVVLPFPAAEYEQDFAQPVTPGVSAAACVAEFRRLIGAAASVTVLPHARAPDPVAGYEAAGEAVVARAALLVGLWDGIRTGKRAGTSETIALAASRGVPVWWLPVAGGAPRVIENTAAFDAHHALPEGAAAWSWLAAWRG
jgi:hypothetical protein